MKTKIGILVLALCTTFFTSEAQRRVVTTTRAMSYDISDNLDLDAVASIFGDSENLEDFEFRLNDPDNRISNLDLNEDGYIDYLRVVENSTDRNSLVVVQAVLDEDIYQDVATIEIEKVQNGRLRVQIVGDSYIYGSNYIIEPVFVHTPVIFSFFWSSHYRPWHSPYYWNYYPRWYSYYSPYPTYKYHRHVHRHINYHNEYHRTSDRNIHFSNDRYNHVRRSDYASRYPNKSFTSRQQGYQNKYELERRRPTNANVRDRNTNVQRSSDTRDYQYNRQSSSGRREKSGTVNQSSRRPSTDVQSGSDRTRNRENSTINNGRTNNVRTEGSGNVNQGRRPSTNVQSGSGNGRTRENSQINTNRSNSGNSGAPVQIKSGNRNESPNSGSGSVTRSKPAPTSSPSRSNNQVDSRRSAPREKSGTVSNSSRGNGETRQAPQSSRKSESPKNEENKDSGNGRRR